MRVPGVVWFVGSTKYLAESGIYRPEKSVIGYAETQRAHIERREREKERKEGRGERRER